MKLREKKELHEKSVEELKKLVDDRRKELALLKLDASRGMVKNTSSMTNIRRGIARMLTIMKEKEVSAAQS